MSVNRTTEILEQITSEDSNGTKTGMDVNLQDQTSDIVDYLMCIGIGVVELSIPAVIDEYTVTLVDATGVIAGTYICLKEGSRVFQAKILSVATNTLTLDTPLDHTFTTATTANNSTAQLAVDGSTTSVAASVFPNSGKWDIVRVIISMTHASSADDGKFGGIAALTKGIVLRKSNGIHHTIFNAKTNGDLRERTYDVTFSDKAPAGEYGTTIRRTFGGQDKNGVVIRLDSELNDMFELIIQDDLTGLTSLRAVAQGHIVVD